MADNPTHAVIPEEFREKPAVLQYIPAKDIRPGMQMFVEHEAIHVDRSWRAWLDPMAVAYNVGNAAVRAETHVGISNAPEGLVLTIPIGHPKWCIKGAQESYEGMLRIAKVL